MAEIDLKGARDLLDAYDVAWENQKGSGSEMKLIVLANYGELALQRLRVICDTMDGVDINTINRLIDEADKEADDGVERA